MAKLTHLEQDVFTDIVTLDYLQLKGIGNGGQLTIGTIPAGGAVELVYIDEAEAVTGTTSLVIDVGTSEADPDEFIDALDVDAMTVPVYNTGDEFTTAETEANKLILAGVVATDTPIILEVTDANIDDITAGLIVVGLRIIDARRFA